MKTKLIATLAVIGVFAIAAGAAFAYTSGSGDCPYGNTPGSGAQMQKKATTKTADRDRMQMRMRDGTGPRHGAQAGARHGNGSGHGSQMWLRDGSGRS